MTGKFQIVFKDNKDTEIGRWNNSTLEPFVGALFMKEDHTLFRVISKNYYDLENECVGIVVQTEPFPK
jgi:hypothetical protein